MAAAPHHGARHARPTASDIEALERATVQAVAPQQLWELPGWLVPVDPGTVGRARSAVPLHHAAPDLAPAASLIAATDGADPPAGVQLTLAPQASAAWTAVFLGADFDPVDGAHRAQALARATGTCFASASVDGVVVACGALSLSHGWAGVHGMRTVAAWRGRGLAAALLRRMAQQAQAAGVQRVFLQVDAGNTGAQSLYRRLGFVTAWSYAYWQPVGAQA